MTLFAKRMHYIANLVVNTNYNDFICKENVLHCKSRCKYELS